MYDVETIASMSYVFRSISECAKRDNVGSFVFDPVNPSRSREVRNLGWLLAHSSEVHDLWVSTYTYKSLNMAGGTPYGRCDWPGGFDAMLAARMLGGKVYATPFADKSLLAEWLLRPKLRGRIVHWDHSVYAIGSDDYMRDRIR